MLAPHGSGLSTLVAPFTSSESEETTLALSTCTSYNPRQSAQEEIFLRVSRDVMQESDRNNPQPVH
jgi:hypothetical protein